MKMRHAVQFKTIAAQMYGAMACLPWSPKSRYSAAATCNESV